MKKAKIEPFGDTLSASVSLLQAANALDVAAQIAETQADTERLVEVAQIYIMISNRLEPGDGDPVEVEGSDGESETKVDPTQFSMGFTANKGEE